MTLVLGSGAFVALERNDRSMWRRLKAAQRSGIPAVTHGGVVAQVWRGGGGRQALLARALATIDVVPLDGALGRRAGTLLARTGSSDAIDAAVAVLAVHGDRIVTSDLRDLSALVEAGGQRVDVVTV